MVKQEQKNKIIQDAISQNKMKNNIKKNTSSKKKQHYIRIPLKSNQQRGNHGKKEHHGIYEIYIKRPLDVICALSALFLLSPVMLVVAVLVKIKLGSPIIFTQERPGLNEKIFKLYKFRSMSDQKDKNGNPLPDEKRLGSFGKSLRATSLDELPELFNILKGDMSIVGPRPLLVRYLPLYNKRQHKRHKVRPGLTGYAQVHGRNQSLWKERLEQDVWYVEHISFWGDLKILLSTIKIVAKRKGISSETCATMEEFQGNL